MATIMASHIAINIAAAAGQLWPGMRIQAIDMVQPPGISMPPDMERQKYTVAAALKANTSRLTE